MSFLRDWQARRNAKKGAKALKRFLQSTAPLRRAQANLKQAWDAFRDKNIPEMDDRLRVQREELLVQILAGAGKTVEEIIAETGIDRRRVIDLVDQIKSTAP